MIKAYFRLIIYIFFNLPIFTAITYAQTDASEKHILTSIRMIGHHLLLDSGDSTSRVLPITKEAATYKIQFESEFQFNPEQFFNTIDHIVKQTQIALRYIVEVETCASREIIYSYEVGYFTKADMIPCATRMPMKACYNVAFTILESVKPNQNGKKANTVFITGILLVAAFIIIRLLLYSRKKKRTTRINPNMVMIGEYQFDTINSELIIQGKRVAFSAKESDLLLLLYSAANITVEREKILKEIWGDEGDYIGRTLDVFISKLRKKLEMNTNLKIVNIRGVGYKLLVHVQA